MSRVLTPANFTAKVRLYAQQARSLRWLPFAVLVVVAVAAFLLGRLTAPGLPDMQGPPSLTLPPHASLVRWEEYPNDHEAIWYYSVPDSSHDAVMSFFKGQMTQGNWSCFTSNLAHSITQNGQSFTGSNGYIAARNGSLDVQINTGDQSFGAFLMQHDLDEHAIALKIDVSTTDQSGCGGKELGDAQSKPARSSPASYHVVAQERHWALSLLSAREAAVESGGKRHISVPQGKCS